MRFQLQDLSEIEFARMHAAVLRLLDEVGVHFEDARATRLLQDGGNTVDEQGRVHLRPAFVEKCLAQLPENGFRLYGRDESRTIDVACDSMSFRPSTGMPFVLDYETGRRRDATMDDARIMATLTDALDGYDMVNSVVSPPDAPGSRGNLRRFLNAHRYSLKPSDITVMNRIEVDAIGRIGAAIRGGRDRLGERPLTAVDVAMVSPLRCTSEQAEAFLECAEWRLPIEVLTSPALAMTGPSTLAGGAALAIAEALAALCLVYQVAPGLGMINTTRVSPTDLRTAAYNYGAPELGMGSVLVAACCARYRFPCNLYGLGTIGHFPGAQVQMEKSLSGLLMALGRPHMITGSGILDNAIVTSPEQLVTDDEAIRFLRRIREPLVIDEDTLAVDLLKSAVQAETDVCLLGEEHTVKHMHRGALLRAGLGQWTAYDTWLEQGRPNLFQRAHERVEAILGSHQVPAFEPALEKEMNRIIEGL